MKKRKGTLSSNMGKRSFKRTRLSACGTWMKHRMKHPLSGFTNDKNNRDTSWDVPYLNSGNERKWFLKVQCISEYGHKFRPMPVVKDTKWLQQGTCINGIPVFKQKN
jgi:hypothetical protein